METVSPRLETQRDGAHADWAGPYFCQRIFLLRLGTLPEASQPMISALALNQDSVGV
jgi:hypothetical protein